MNNENWYLRFGLPFDPPATTREEIETQLNNVLKTLDGRRDTVSIKELDFIKLKKETIIDELMDDTIRERYVREAMIKVYMSPSSLDAKIRDIIQRFGSVSTEQRKNLAAEFNIPNIDAVDRRCAIFEKQEKLARSGGGKKSFIPAPIKKLFPYIKNHRKKILKIGILVGAVYYFFWGAGGIPEPKDHDGMMEYSDVHDTRYRPASLNTIRNVYSILEIYNNNVIEESKVTDDDSLKDIIIPGLVQEGLNVGNHKNLFGTTFAGGDQTGTIDFYIDGMPEEAFIFHADIYLPYNKLEGNFKSDDREKKLKVIIKNLILSEFDGKILDEAVHKIVNADVDDKVAFRLISVDRDYVLKRVKVAQYDNNPQTKRKRDIDSRDIQLVLSAYPTGLKKQK